MFKILVISNSVFLRNLLANQQNMEFIFADQNELQNIKLKDFSIILLDERLKDEVFLELIKKSAVEVISFDKDNIEKFDRINFLPKPIQIRNLFELIRGLLAKQELAVLYFDDFFIDVKKRLLVKNQNSIKLTELETRLAKFLFDKNKKYSKKDLLVNVWGYKNADLVANTTAVETAITALRKKFESVAIKVDF